MVLGRFRALLGSAFLLLAGCGGADRSASPSEPARPGFRAAWSEFLPTADVREAVPLLSRFGLEVNLAWHADALDDPERLALARDAERAGVEVRPWLLLPVESGYWPGATNSGEFVESARELMDVWDREGLEPSVLIVDMEMNRARADETRALLETDEPDLAALLAFFRGGIDRERFERARGDYASLADEAHARGWKMLLTTLPQVLDDFDDGDDDLRQALEIPVEGIDWDVLSFQVYTTLAGDLLGGVSGGATPGPYFVYDYLRTAQELFGERAAADIGMIGEGVGGTTFETGAQLHRDLEAAHAAGIPRERITVFNLDGIVQRPPESQWLGPPIESAVVPPDDGAAAAARRTSRLLDDALD